ncbi:hypothetical protein J7T62_02840, partial [Lactobacillus delbrueckii subsp. lactis]|uniref:hypothetical protein n=1 Tax=Lactobacillus delbrueckii TaxID=1584 RepID=UPI0035CF1D67
HGSEEQPPPTPSTPHARHNTGQHSVQRDGIYPATRPDWVQDRRKAQPLNDTNALAALSEGMTPKRAVIYLRVSTSEQATN